MKVKETSIPCFVDFHSAKIQYRSGAHINAEKLVKAVVGKKIKHLKVLDALPVCKVLFVSISRFVNGQSCESNPLMFALLKDGFLRGEY